MFHGTTWFIPIASHCTLFGTPANTNYNKIKFFILFPFSSLSVNKYTSRINFVYLKFYIRRYKNKINTSETGNTVIAHLFLWNDQENWIHHAFLIIDDQILSLLLYFKIISFVSLFEQRLSVQPIENSMKF